MRSILLWLTLVSAVSAAPLIRDIVPHGAERGKNVIVTLRGDGLQAGAKLETTLPAGISRMVPAEEARGVSLPFLIQLKADAPSGLYPVRLVTDDGISNIVLFSVGDLPEVEENEVKNPKQLNNSPETAEAISIPAVINGTLTGADEDYYSFQVRAGQKLVFEVEARRAGSAIDPAIEIFDASGRAIAKNDDAPGLGVDCRTEVTFAKAGQYRVLVHDSKYSEQAPNFYRLKIGEWSYADAIFPLGWRRGQPVEVTLAGGNLSKPVKLRPSTDSKKPMVPVHVPGSAALPLYFALSDQEEMLEPEGAGPAALKEGVIMNGRISKPGEVDRYRVAVRPGEQWMFELLAAKLGTSELDGIVTLYDAKGKKLASRDDLAGADPALPITVPDGAQEIFVAVEDVLGRGGPAYGYRLQARRSPPDFAVELVSPFVNVPAGGTAQVAVNVQRRGYEGALRLVIPNLPKGFAMAGGHVPPEAAAQDFMNLTPGYKSARSIITLTADADVPPQILDLTVLGIADTPSGRIERWGHGPGMVTVVRGDKRTYSAAWLGLDLPMGVSKPLPITLAVAVPLARFSQGFEWSIGYRVERRGGVMAPVKVKSAQSGAVGNLRILKSPPPKDPDKGTIVLSSNFATPATVFDMILEATVDLNGRPMTISSRAMEVEVVTGYSIELDKANLTVSPGSRTEIRGRVRREPTFEGSLVRVKAEDLPDQVHCDAADVAGAQSEFVLSCEAPKNAPPGDYPIRITSVAPDTGRKTKDEYKIPDLNARLVVGSAAQASR